MFQEFLLSSKTNKRFYPLIIIVIFSSTLFANHISRGEKIVNIFCQKEKLKSLNIKNLTKDEILKYCHDIDLEDTKDIKAYLSEQNITHKNLPQISPIPKDARCPVCGMAINLYPKWSSLITTKDKRYYFDGVKDMMKYYLDKASFHYNRDRITNIVVREFYHFKDIDAKSAWYVIGSEIRGPMGNELIPFKSKKDAKTFMQDHHGKKIVRFSEITLSLIKSLKY